MTLYLAAALLRAVAAVVAIALARRRAEARPLALFLAGTTLAGFARVALVRFILTPERAAMQARGIDPAAVPFSTSPVLAAVYLYGALALTYAAGLAALGCYAFTTRPRLWAGITAAAWLLGSVALAAWYPAIRGPAFQRVLLGADLAALAVIIGTGITWGARRENPHVGHVGLIILASIDIAGLIAGPWRRSIFAHWETAQALSIVASLALMLIAGREAWKSSQQSK